MATEYKLSYTANEIDERLGKIDSLATKNEVPTKTSQLNNDSGFITGYTETDPTVPAWAKASTKPSYTKSEVGLGNIDNVKQYSVNNPPPYPVTSVNGKTGEVALVPSDIGAEPFGLATSIVSAHNIDSVAHEDIRTQINNLFLEIADKEQLKPEFVNSIEDCTDASKLYVLPDGYIYAYMGHSNEGVSYSNLADPTSEDWAIDSRINSSGNVVSGSTGNYVTNYIPCKMDDVIRIKGLNARALSGSNNTSANVLILDAAKTKLRYSALGSETGGHVTVDGDIITVVAGHYNSANYTNTAYMRFCGCLLDGYTLDDVVITVNEEITEVEETIVYEWTNTGLPFVSIQNVDGDINVNGNVEFVDSIDYCTDKNKLYVLPDGYIYAYITKETYTEASELFDRNACTLNSRYSGTTTKTANGYYITDFIPVDMSLSDPIVLRFKGGKMWTGSGDKLMLFDSSKAVIDTTYIYSDESSGSNLHHEVYADGDDYCINLGYVATTGASTKHASYANIAYIRINQCINSSGTELTINEVPDVSITIDAMGGISTETGWLNTGCAFVPVDYEDRILSLENYKVSSAARIDTLEKKVSAVSSGEADSVYPSFWDNAVSECINKIKALQVGKNCVTFPFFSDNHQRNGYSGALIAKIMNECHIPYCFYGGDSISSGYIASEAVMIAQDKAFDTMMKAIPNGRFCRAVGNHDGFWNVSAKTGDEYHYTREQVYELFLREESIAQNKHFGDDGTYYYVDDIASRVRFVVLNTNGIYDESGSVVGSTFDSSQLEWLQNIALVFSESGWAVVFFSHAPITNNFHSNISNAQEVQTILTSYINGSAANKADVIGWFSGHIHRDRIYQCDHTGKVSNDDQTTVDLPWKTVTITSDHTGIAYDDATKHTVADDNQSHAIDFVTINKDTRTVSITRLGIGNDRSYTY